LVFVAFVLFLYPHTHISTELPKTKSKNNVSRYLILIAKTLQSLANTIQSESMTPIDENKTTQDDKKQNGDVKSSLLGTPPKLPKRRKRNKKKRRSLLKEPYMKCMIPFVMKNVKRVRDMLDRLTVCDYVYICICV